MTYLKTLRNQLGLSQPVFAGLLNCSTGQLSMAESGLRSLPQASLALAAELNKALAATLAARQVKNTPGEKTKTLLAKHIRRCQVQVDALEINTQKLDDKLQAAGRMQSLAGSFKAPALVADVGDVQLQMNILQRKATKKIKDHEEKLTRLQLTIAGLQGEIAKAKELITY